MPHHEAPSSHRPRPLWFLVSDAQYLRSMRPKLLFHNEPNSHHRHVCLTLEDVRWLVEAVTGSGVFNSSQKGGMRHPSAGLENTQRCSFSNASHTLLSFLCTQPALCMAVRIPSRSCRFWAYKLKFSCLPELPTQSMHLTGSFLCFKAFSNFFSSQNRGMFCSAAFKDLVIWFQVISSTPLSSAPLHEALVQNQIWTGTFPLLFFSRLPCVPSFLLVPPMLDWGYTKVRAQFQHLLRQMSFPLGVLSVLLCTWSTFLGTSITEVTMECLSLQLCIDLSPPSICCCCCY